MTKQFLSRQDRTCKEVILLSAELDHSLEVSQAVLTYSLRPDKMITGTKSLHTIEKSMNWKSKRLPKRRRKINKT